MLSERLVSAKTMVSIYLDDSDQRDRLHGSRQTEMACLVFSDGQISNRLMNTASVSVRIAGSRGELGAVTACCWFPFLCSPDAGAALGCLGVGRFDRGGVSSVTNHLSFTLQAVLCVCSAFSGKVT